MRWQGGRESENVEDRRGQGGFGGGGFGGGFGGRGGGIRIGRGGLGIGGAIVLLVVSMVLGVDPTVLLGGGEQADQSTGRTRIGEAAPRSQADDELKRFVSVVLADTEDTWQGLFQQMGRQYQDPTLVLFTGTVSSGCGRAQAAMGPFYCPMDRKLYIDLGFYRELRDRFRAPGDFAQAYVIAHEVGHHVQNLLGISDKVQAAQQRARGQAEANALSVRLELQADCFAGIWGNHANRDRRMLEPGDVEEALTAASAIGDDRLQRQARGTVSPDSFTHGSSAQRVRWFRTGLESGRLEACDTFGTDRP
ncbi:putative metalloprotease [Azospirillum lipoferum]|uniref:Flagellar biosynthesis protein FlgM n=1 Tax=Azospirillum lipoferum TaxID=193 RepID=A0A5A9GHB1_AZOLI|nr:MULTISPECIES: neutral zinc metallopeptidase [Azospirillum]KAA0593821.1 flagellar biosynthesis protein FlgM [Azospirillum lipoferum]MCP1614115.1 putative metalloprotease [Azospirillum lipoferum]MDW5536802.1 neutral zinc metallopeptidase [Azospirillum sp. NL1]